MNDSISYPVGNILPLKNYTNLDKYFLSLPEDVQQSVLEEDFISEEAFYSRLKELKMKE